MFQGVGVLLGLWAIFLSFFRIGVPQVLWDEPIYALAGWRYVHGETFAPGQGGSLGEFADNFEHPPFAKYLFGLSEVVAGGQSITATRVVAALACLATAALIGWWLARRYDRWTGLAAAAVVAITPLVVPPSVVRFGRLGMLDSVAGMLLVASLLLAWRWSTRTGRDALRWAIAAGVVAGLATSAKESGFLVLLGPVLLTMWQARRSLRQLRDRLLQSAVMAVVAVGTFIATYLPVGHPFARIDYLWTFQTRHSRLGHPVVVAGRSMTHPPWWANLWFAWNGLGALLAILLAVGVLAALALNRDRVVAFWGAALVGPIVFFFFVADVALPFYWVMWVPLAMAVSVTGWRALVLWAARLAPHRAWTVPLAAGVVAALAAVPAVGNTGTTATLQAVGVQRVPLVMRAGGLHGPILATGVSVFDLRTYLHDYQVAGTPTRPGPADTVVIGSPRCGVATDRVAAALVSLNLKRGRIQKLYADPQVVVYGRTAPLLAPGYLDVVTIQPPKC